MQKFTDYLQDKGVPMTLSFKATSQEPIPELPKIDKEPESCQLAGNTPANDIVDLLKNALKEELNAWYGYVIVKEFLCGPHRKSIQEFYAEAAEDELEDHGYWLMKRISELGGIIEDISMSPESWSSAKHKYIAPTWLLCDDSAGIATPVIDITQSLLDNIENERGAIETYKELVVATEDVDPVSNAKLKEILADEEEHLKELEDFYADININKENNGYQE